MRDCASRKRKIGHRGSQTETIRGMIPLHEPFARSSVAAAFELYLPAPARDEAEPVAQRLRRADAPARCCRARPFSPCRTEQEKRQSRSLGSQMQPSAGL